MSLEPGSTRRPLRNPGSADAVRAYTGRDIAFIIPTKDRPERVAVALESLARQTEPCGRVIVVASGRDIRDVVLRFAPGLNVEYQHCEASGQMRQRNLGISVVPPSARLVAFLDDDIVLEPNALDAMVRYWNAIEQETAGVAFNLMGLRRRGHSALGRWFRRMFPPGHVYKSGFSTPLSEVDQSREVMRLNGGATIWHRAILEEFEPLQIDTNWAIGEDLIFSYPIGRKYPLRVCAEARVLHDHPQDRTPGHPHHEIRGRTLALWQLYFVTLNRELSVFAYAVTALGLAILGMGVGLVVPGRGYYRRFYLGLARGALQGLMTLFRGKALLPLLNTRPDATAPATAERSS
jgi:GT2 family glycosyltransferase